MPDLTALYSFAVSLLIGLVIGIERERSHPVDVESAGVRTFMLLGLTGALTAKFANQEMIAVFAFFVALLVIAGYWRSTKRNSTSGIGFTTEVSAMFTFGLGILSASDHALALVLGIVVFAILYSRTWLHHFSREILQPKEIRAVLILAFLLVGIMPLLPKEAIDPWGLLHLQNLAKVIGALAAIQFASHVAIRAFGQNLGILLTGFFTGFVSSTTVFLTLPMKVKRNPELVGYFYSAGLLATVATLLEFLVVLAMIDAELLSVFAVPVLAMILTGVLFAIRFGRKSTTPQKAKDVGIEPMPASTTVSPLDLKSVFKLSALFSVMLLVVSASNRWLGKAALSATVFLGGLFELQGVSYSTAELFLHGDLQKNLAVLNLSLAVSAALLSKVMILGFLNHGRFAMVMSGILVLMFTVGAGALFITLRVLS